MRDRKLWLKMLSVFAFAIAQVPANVVASLWHSNSCGMPCCAGKAPESRSKSSEKTKHGCCSKKSGTAIQSSENDGCGCKISGTTQPFPTSVAVSPSNFIQFADVEAIAAQIQGQKVAEPLKLLSVGIVGTDSGPPISWPKTCWLGRAPPTLAF